MDEVFKIIEDMPPWFWLGWLFLLGSFVGSFLNVVVYRLPRNCLSINYPRRSFCPSCKTQLRWNDNLPIIGWLLLRGKCRYCGAKYGIRYPAVELLTAVLFAFAAWRVLYADGNLAGQWAAWLTLLHILLMIGVLLPWALIDLDLTYIPDKLTLGPLLVFVPFAAHADALQFGLTARAQRFDLTDVSAAVSAGHQYTHLWFDFTPIWLNSVISAVLTGIAAAGVLWLIGKASNVIFAKRAQQIGGESMGLADVKLMVLLGVMLGWPKMLAAFFVAIFVGAIIGSVQLLLKKTHGTPFGPYLTLGALVAALGSNWIRLLYDWYMGILQGLA